MKNGLFILFGFFSPLREEIILKRFFVIIFNLIMTIGCFICVPFMVLFYISQEKDFVTGREMFIPWKR